MGIFCIEYCIERGLKSAFFNNSYKIINKILFSRFVIQFDVKNFKKYIDNLIEKYYHLIKEMIKVINFD